MNTAATRLLRSGLGDYRLKSFAWSEDGNDVLLVLRSAGVTVQDLCIRFIWATKVRIDLDFGSYAGMPLLFECSFATEGTGVHRVHFQFGGAPDGEISLECNEAVVDINNSTDSG
jgi:hypothetical protein